MDGHGARSPNLQVVDGQPVARLGGSTAAFKLERYRGYICAPSATDGPA